MKASFGLYAHIPYCIKKCPYCDFNSYGTEGQRIPEASYTEALLTELSHYAVDRSFRGRKLRTLFFGGGTPSLFSADSIEKIVKTADSEFGFLKNAEVTLETNPGTVQEQLGREKLRAFRDAGVNRISIGAQSFSTEKLKFLGRIHSPENTLRAVENVVTAGFDNFNLDLMFGIKDELAETWNIDLDTAISLSPKHISAYSLTIEPGTEFGREATRGTVHKCSNELTASMYQAAQSKLFDAGFEQYEISNYALPSFECKHNLGYWQGIDYLGIGAGAHSCVAERAEDSFAKRWANIPGPAQYITRVKQSGAAVQLEEEISRPQAEIEFFFLGLRTKQGINRSAFEKKFGETLDKRYGPLITQLEKEQLLYRSDELIALSKRGFLLSDSVFSAFSEIN